jgi:hypothetical protein
MHTELQLQQLLSLGAVPRQGLCASRLQPCGCAAACGSGAQTCLLCDPEHVVFGSARYQSIDGASEAFVRSPMRTCFESSDVQAANRVWTHPGCRQEHCVEETSYKPEVVS